jgi:hypothetical protein
MTHSRCVHRRIPTTLLAIWNATYQATPQRRKATMTLATRTYPRVSPGTLRGIGKRYTWRPSGRKGDTRKHHRVGVEATWISPDPQKTTPRTIQSAPPSLPPTNTPPRPCNHHRRLSVNHVARPARQKRGNSYEGSSTVASGRERPPPPLAVADRMQRQGQPGPYWPGQA